MARGGARTGKPGSQYPNRQDLQQTPRAARGQTYGEAGRQLRAQNVIPLPQGGQLPQPTGQPTERVPTGTDSRGQIPSLEDLSGRPNEPVTAGLPIGPGAGPEALRMAPFGPEELSILRLVFARYPSEDLRRTIEWTENNL